MAYDSAVYYHFTGSTLRDGRPIPPVGEWLIHDGPAVMCKSGLHASPTPWAALQYAPGEILHQVNLRNIVEAHKNDKSVAHRRKILASIDATDILRRFARSVALDVIHLWNAPAIVREYLESGDESKRAAAGAAAWDAAWAAAGAAAWDAAWAAAEDAAGAAAWAAAEDAAGAAARAAAWAAAGAAAWDRYGLMFNAMVEEAFPEADNA